MQEPYLSDFGYLSDTAATTAVLDGTCKPHPDMDPYLVELLRAAKQPATIRALGPVRVTVTPEENTAAWGKQDEHKASEPTCLSFAHH